MHHRLTHPHQANLTQTNDLRQPGRPARRRDGVATASKIDAHQPTPRCSRPNGPLGYPTRPQTPIRRSSRTGILRMVSLAAAILTLGADANIADTAEAQRSTGCVTRQVVSHVPGHLDKVWVLRCIPTRPTIN